MAAEFRSVQTRMWREDEWYQSLPTDARLLFIYFFTNPSASISGIYRLPLRTVEFESGIPMARIQELLAIFSAAGKVHYEDGTVWVVRMRENQIPGNISPKVQIRLDKDVAAIPDSPLKARYLAHYGYPIRRAGYPMDTVSIPDRTDTDTDTDTETDTETEPATDTLPLPAVVRASPSEDPPSPPTPVAPTRSDADLTRAVVAKMEAAGIGVTEITVDTYVAAAMDYGIHAVLQGIDAAAQNGKQHKSSYVLACIRNKAMGSQPGKGGTNGNGGGWLSKEEKDKIQSDLRAVQSRIRTAEKLGSSPAPRDLALLASLQKRIEGG